MLKLFKHNNIWQAIIIVIVIVLLWTRAFVSPVAGIPDAEVFSPLYSMLFGWTTSLPRLASAVALIIIILEGLWLNILLFNHKMVPPGSLLPLMLYIVAMSWETEILTITPILIVNLLLLATVQQLLSDGSAALSVERNFNAFFCIGTATLFYLPAWCLIIYLILVLVIYKMYNWRHLASSLLGLAGPLVLMFLYAFMTDRADYLLFLFNHDIADIEVNIDHVGLYPMLRNIFFVVLFTLTTITQVAQTSDSTIHQRINTWVLVLPLIGAIAMMLYTRLIPADTGLLATTFSFSTSTTLFLPRKKKWINETIFVILIILSIVIKL